LNCRRVGALLLTFLNSPVSRSIGFTFSTIYTTKFTSSRFLSLFDFKSGGMDFPSVENDAEGHDEATGNTYVAFTATPNAKTLEIVGRLPDPTQPCSIEGSIAI
jgi:hypothetical protein